MLSLLESTETPDSGTGKPSQERFRFTSREPYAFEIPAVATTGNVAPSANAVPLGKNRGQRPLAWFVIG
jgi:hypothetical protein